MGVLYLFFFFKNKNANNRESTTGPGKLFLLLEKGTFSFLPCVV